MRLHYEGTELFIGADELDPVMLEDLLDLGGPGLQDENVAAFMQRWTVTGNVEDCRLYLKGYWAWDDVELQDHEANLARLVWLTGGGLHAEGEAYFSAYRGDLD